MEELSQVFRPSISIRAVEPTHVGEARRAVAALTSGLGFGETAAGQAAIVVTELTNNLVRHARDGELIIRTMQTGRNGGIELIAIDRGPGLANIPRALRDGYSSAGTAGNGLGAIIRLSTDYDLFSVAGQGTVQAMQVWAHPHPHSESYECAAISLPKPGEVASGDGWGMDADRDRAVLFVVDGLGHGLAASEAARTALRIFDQEKKDDLPRLIHTLHAGLRPTRGAAAAIAVLEPAKKQVRFIGVGNISGVIESADGTRSMVSHNGTLGAELRRVQEFSYPWPPGGLLVLHSDGLSAHWTLSKYLGLRQKRLAVIAGVLYRDFRRSRDDATVLAVRNSSDA
jgi:anti-sigma regulatory factor (Ser/Thr protein kinase)